MQWLICTDIKQFKHCFRFQCKESLDLKQYEDLFFEKWLVKYSVNTYLEFTTFRKKGAQTCFLRLTNNIFQHLIGIGCQIQDNINQDQQQKTNKKQLKIYILFSAVNAIKSILSKVNLKHQMGTENCKQRNIAVI